MLSKWLPGLDIQSLFWRPLRLLARCWRTINITTDGHYARATDCMRWCLILRLGHRAVHEGLESINTTEYICGMNDHFMRNLRDRYEVIYDSPSPMAIILNTAAAIHAEMSSPLHLCRLSTNVTTEATSKVGTMITVRLGLWSCTRGIGKALVLALLEV